MDNQTVIDTVVKYSRDCIVKRFIKSHLLKSLTLAKTQNLPSANTIKIVIDELDMKLDEKEADIGKLLEPLFEGRDFGHKNSKKHSLTISELRDGYILLQGEKFVILLTKIYEPQLKLNYEPGILYPFNSALEDVLKKTKLSGLSDGHDLLSLIIKKKNAYEYIE